MSDYEVNKKVYTLCYTQLYAIKLKLEEQVQFVGFTKEERLAQMKIVDSLFGLASAATITNGMQKRFRDDLITITRDIEDVMAWNPRASEICGVKPFDGPVPIINHPSIIKSRNKNRTTTL